MHSRIASSFQDDIARMQSRLAIEAEARGARVISLFAMDRKAGATTLAIALARSLASQSLPITLVDADTTTPAIHQFFRIPQAPGTAELLASAAPRTGAVRESATANLAVLPAGNWPVPVPGILSQRWKEVFTPFLGGRAMVIVDAGKAGAVNADAIARASDSVVLVVEAGHSTREQVAAFAAHMEEIGVPCLGVVLNKWRRGPRDAA